MSRRNVFVLILVAVVLTCLSVAMSRRDSRDWRANRSRRLLPFPWQDTADIRIKRPDGDELHFTRAPGGEWKIQLPDGLEDTLNPGAVDELAAFATLTWREPLANRPQPNPDTATTLTAKNHAGQSVSLTFGDLAQNLRATQIDNDATIVYGVNQDLLIFLDREDSRFRNYFLAAAAGGRKPKKISINPAADATDLAVTLEHHSGSWRLTQPVAWPVDDARLDLLLRWLDRLRGDGIVAEMSGDLEWFGFTPPSASVDVWYDTPDGEIHRRVEFGKEDGSGKIFARDAERNPIFALPGEVLDEISITSAREHPALWRNFYRKRALNPIGNKLPETIVVEQLLPRPVKLTLTLDHLTNKWQGKLDTGERTRTFPVDAPDAGDPMRPLTSLLTGMASLRVKNFLADQEPGPGTLNWTAYPAWRVAVRFTDGTSAPELTLYADNARGEFPSGIPYLDGAVGPQKLTPLPDQPDNVGFAFSLAGSPSVMETFGEMSYLLCQPPYRYQSKRLIDTGIRAWRRVAITAGKEINAYYRPENEVNEQWWRQDTASEPLMEDNNRFVGMLLKLSQLRADGFVSDADGDIAEFGLDQPQITAIVYSSPEASADETGAQLFQLSLGKTADKDGRRYARLGDSGPVFVLPADISNALGEKYR